MSKENLSDEKLNKIGKDKPAFQFYNKYIKQFEKLTDAEAGKLIKHILYYVNDLEPDDLDNRLLNIIFLNIKEDLKTDLRKWLASCKKNTINGKKGGRPNNK